MNFKKIKIITTPVGTELLPAELLELGITGFEIDDAPSFEEFLNDKRVPWDYVEEALLEKRSCDSAVTVYLCENRQGEEQLESIKALCESHKKKGESELYGSLEIVTDEVKEDDWANNWKQYFKPLKIGERILIKPSWETVSKEDEEKYKIVKLDPGSSFGTGQHETTKLCLEVLQNNKTEGARVLDMGCGSGILTIASMLLGADSALAVDIDQNACDIARENLCSNGFGPERAEVLCGDATSDMELYNRIVGAGEYDVILANIVADVVIRLIPDVGSFMDENAVILVSGIIEPRRDEVVEALAEYGYQIIDSREEKGWCAMAAVRA